MAIPVAQMVARAADRWTGPARGFSFFNWPGCMDGNGYEANMKAAKERAAKFKAESEAEREKMFGKK